MKLLLTICATIFYLFVNAQTSQVTYAPYLYKNKFVFCDSNGKQVIDSSFDYAEPFYQNYAIVGNNSKFGVINSKGKIIVPLQYRNAKLSYEYSLQTTANPNGIYFAVNYSDFSFNNNKEELYFSYVGKKIPNEQISTERLGTSYHPGTIIKKDEKYGFVDYRDTIIPPQYNKLETTSWYTDILIATKGDSVGIISNTNEIIIPFMYKKIIVNNKNENMFKIYTSDSKYCFLYIIFSFQ